MFTADKSCTMPSFASTTASAPQLFVNYAYTGSNDDGAGTTLDRTREGYVEIIEMGNVTGTTATAVTHVVGRADLRLAAERRRLTRWPATAACSAASR